jgi:hypothetical protein
MLTLHDIMAEDHMIYANLQQNGEINVRVINEETTEENAEVYAHVGHRYAWESLVYFAHQILTENQRIIKQQELRNA